MIDFLRKNGIILKEDIMELMGSKPGPSERKIKHGPEERVKMTRLRLTIAKRLKEAQEIAAMLLNELARRVVNGEKFHANCHFEDIVDGVDLILVENPIDPQGKPMTTGRLLQHSLHFQD